MGLRMPKAFGLIASLILVAVIMNSSHGEPEGNSTASRPANKLATVQEMCDALTDVWGDAAMREPNGASYEFFKDLLPPLLWVNTDFRYYPIVLSAPQAPAKVR